MHEAKKTAQGHSPKTSLLPPALEKSQAGQHPLLVMVDIAKDEALSRTDRAAPIEYAKSRYRRCGWADGEAGELCKDAMVGPGSPKAKGVVGQFERLRVPKWHNSC